MSDEPKAGPRPALSMPDGTGDHRRAQELASKATIAIAQGDRAGALLLYREAAVLERAAFAQIAPGKARTWCLLAISAASLLYKGRQFEEAERALYLMLSRPDLPAWAFRELRELLDAVRDSQALPLGTHYGDRVLSFTLRGASIGSGTAPIDLMVEKGGAISRYITRGVEWVGRAPIRRASSAKDEVKSLIEARVTQPTAGSYRFSVKLVEPYQLPLFEDPSRPIVTAAAVGDTLFGLARQATSDSPSATDAMRELVPDDEYRTVMLGLLRGIVPAGDQLSEVEIGYERPGAESSPVSSNIVTLPAGARGRISRAILLSAPQAVDPPGPKDEKVEVRGRLRALNLDKGWFAIVSPTGSHNIRAKSPMDDIIGPLVNKDVVARVLPTRDKGADSFLLLDPVRDLDLDEV